MEKLEVTVFTTLFAGFLGFVFTALYLHGLYHAIMWIFAAWFSFMIFAKSFIDLWMTDYEVNYNSGPNVGCKFKPRDDSVYRPNVHYLK